MRTRVGYTGGTKADPDYHHLGDHTESIQIDFDPSVITYDEMLDIFWASHAPTRGAWSTQYKAAVFFADEGQRAAAEASRDRVADALGRQVTTEVLPLGRFYLAEDYHQKYRLRGDRMLLAEFEAMYPDPGDLTGSTAAARANAFLSGCAYSGDAERLAGRLGLSDEAVRHLLARVRRGAEMRC